MLEQVLDLVDALVLVSICHGCAESITHHFGGSANKKGGTSAAGLSHSAADALYIGLDIAL